MATYDLRLFDRMTKLIQNSPCLTKGLTTPCWRWNGSINRGGYGRVSVKLSDGIWRPQSAHRAAYQIFIAPIPEGLELDHLCRIRHCCNPWHLEPVTKTVNVRRGLAPITSGQWLRERTQCPKGHPYDEENTRVSPSSRRHCRACARDRARQNRAKATTQRPPKAPRTHCSKGHEYTAENTRPAGGGRRKCRACVREESRAARERRNAT
ncbi:HNH endonuclease signature motif containing protein [Streptomyces olivaceoviridis]|uniref:HNH endonuclease signature motif containing protein n=1 Tax=Streptomyces olivaceoviridis TaxID=1921 RepID=UPI003700BEC2